MIHHISHWNHSCAWNLIPKYSACYRNLDMSEQFLINKAWAENIRVLQETTH